MLFASQYLAVAMVFVLIFPIALMNVVAALTLLLFILSGGWREKWEIIKAHPATRPSLLLFALFFIGVLYSSADISYSLRHLSKYRDLLLFPIAILIFSREDIRRRAYFAFLVAIGIAVLVSFSMRLGLLAQYIPGQEWVPFRGRISYGFYLAFATYLMLHQALQAASLRAKVLWSIFAVVAAFDLLFLVSGRTGHLMLVALIALLIVQNLPLVKKYWLMVIFVLSAVTSVTVLTSPAISSRSNDIETAISKPENSSIGQRLIFWQVSLRIIREHPLFGAGTGSFAVESVKFSDYPEMKMDNPHNEYLLIANQLGLVGLIGFLAWLWVLFKASLQLPQKYRVAMQGLVVAMMVGCIFNSFLRDEGHFFMILSSVFLSSLLPDKT